MERDAKSVACVREARDIPWQAYALPGDARKARNLAKQRRELALQLATHADGDGTSITAGISRLLKNLGWKKRTLHRRLNDLEELGILSGHGLTKERGTRLRRLNFSALTTPGAGVPDRAGVPNGNDAPGVPDSTPGVPDSTPGVPDTMWHTTVRTNRHLTDPLPSSREENMLEEQNSEEQNSKARSAFSISRKKKQKPVPSAEAVELAALLRSLVLENNPTAIVKDKNWALEADRMLRLDHRSAEQIRDVIVWSQADPFWHRNVLSVDKLRKQFDRLTLERNAKKGGYRHGYVNRAQQRKEANLAARDAARAAIGHRGSVDRVG